MHHHNVYSAKALYNSRVLNMNTAKRSHLPPNITAKDRAKQFCATAISSKHSFIKKSMIISYKKKLYEPLSLRKICDEWLVVVQSCIVFVNVGFKVQ